MSEEILGRSLVASDLMKKKVKSFTPETKVSEAIKILAKNKISGAPVLDEAGKVIGIFTESDILKYFSVHPNEDVSILNVKIIYTENPKTIPPNMPLFKLQQILIEHGFRGVPVVDENNFLLGMISRRDVMKYIYVVNRKRAMVWQT